jgi:hypothetical protein
MSSLGDNTTIVPLPENNKNVFNVNLPKNEGKSLHLSGKRAIKRRLGMGMK